MKKTACVILLSAFAASGAYANHHGDKERKMEAPALVGMFAGEAYQVTMFPEGLMAVAGKESGMPFVILKYGAKDGVLWMKDIAPPMGAPEEDAKCVTENKGKYNYAEADGAVTFTLIEDPCASRVQAVDGAVLMRFTPPAPDAE